MQVLCASFASGEETLSNVYCVLMVRKHRQILIIATLTVIAFLVILLLYGLSFPRTRTIRITLVDYRWNPIANVSVRWATSLAEYVTDDHGQIIVDVVVQERPSRIESIQVLADGIPDQVLPPALDDVTVRLDTINRDTGELYDDHALPD